MYKQMIYNIQKQKEENIHMASSTNKEKNTGCVLLFNLNW